MALLSGILLNKLGEAMNAEFETLNKEIVDLKQSVLELQYENAQLKKKLVDVDEGATCSRAKRIKIDHSIDCRMSRGNFDNDSSSFPPTPPIISNSPNYMASSQLPNKLSPSNNVFAIQVDATLNKLHPTEQYNPVHQSPATKTLAFKSAKEVRRNHEQLEVRKKMIRSAWIHDRQPSWEELAEMEENMDEDVNEEHDV
ncbi:hypothetical protein BTUL_0125g00060 [Botrytis tulipae]|uniref:Uncharacterized protein n=1 Tax=Botrytis tulipae TaxID=87230 RepID=A0A4Z1EK86_9HELO|nr:hypothetical protein BTUL_0125g00060 [Botrytis tulipae]